MDFSSSHLVTLPDSTPPIGPVTIYDGHGQILVTLTADEFRRLHPESRMFRNYQIHQTRPPKPKKLDLPVRCGQCLAVLSKNGDCWGCGNPKPQVRERYASRRPG